MGFVLLGGAAYVFLTEPALTKQDIDRLKFALKHVQLEKDKVRRNTFLSLVETRDRSLSRAQLEQAFDAVDNDLSGAIDRNEWRQFVGEDKMAKLARQAENVADVAEVVDALAPLRVKSMWAAARPTLEALEGLLRASKKALRELEKQIRNKIGNAPGFDIAAIPKLDDAAQNTVFFLGVHEGAGRTLAAPKRVVGRFDVAGA